MWCVNTVDEYDYSLSKSRKLMGKLKIKVTVTKRLKQEMKSFCQQTLKNK